jgi:hypothetical protein
VGKTEVLVALGSTKPPPPPYLVPTNLANFYVSSSAFYSSTNL